MFKRLIGFGVVLLFQLFGLISASAQEAAQTFTLETSIEYALSNSREFQVAQKERPLQIGAVRSERWR